MVQTTTGYGPPTGSSPINFECSSLKSDESVCSSLLEPGSADSEIVKRNLITDFLSATSIPVNVPLHRYKEAVKPNTPMRLEFGKCTKLIRESLANKLFASSCSCEEREAKEINPIMENLNIRQSHQMIFHMEI